VQERRRSNTLILFRTCESMTQSVLSTPEGTLLAVAVDSRRCFRNHAYRLTEHLLCRCSTSSRQQFNLTKCSLMSPPGDTRISGGIVLPSYENAMCPTAESYIAVSMKGPRTSSKGLLLRKAEVYGRDHAESQNRKLSYFTPQCSINLRGGAALQLLEF
jgi:hypothetical protein